MMTDLPFNILTDLPTIDTMVRNFEDVARDDPALEKIFIKVSKRLLVDANDNIVPLPEGQVTVEELAVLFYLITKIKPVLSIESGFDYGLAAATMICAHAVNKENGGHVPIQDRAKQVNDGIGAHILSHLGLENYQLMDHETAIVLPEIYLQQLGKGLLVAYFNQAENFETQMMEYFYINRLLNEGGIIVVNMKHPARVKFVEAIKQERSDYAVRELSCGLTLIQKPSMAALAAHQPKHRH